MYRKPLHIFAVVLSCCTVFLLAAGGMVTSTGSGLAVPDWPLSYGKLMPPMIGGIFYEHGHRMIASGVGLLTVILTAWILWKEDRRWVRRLAVAALFAVIVQGVLGGLTVLLLLPTWVSSTHATLAQSFFCVVCILALATSRWWMEKSQAQSAEIPRSVTAFTLGLTAGVFLQLMFGAVMRHSQAGMVVPDFPFAYGSVFPSVSSESLRSYESLLIQSDFRLAADGPISGFQIIIHLIHRYWGFLLILMSLAFGTYLIQHRAKGPMLGRAAVYFPLLFLVQGTLGYLVIHSRKDAIAATLHQTTGAIVLGSLAIFSGMLLRLRYRSQLTSASHRKGLP